MIQDSVERSNRGTRRSFPSYRNTVLDIIRHSQSVPSFPLIRRMRLASLNEARSDAALRISWTTLLIKAYGIVSHELPELRDVYVRYPRRQLYRHPHSVASVSIHRKDEHGNERLIFGRLAQPETQSLQALQCQLDAFRTGPLTQVFREGLALERKPTWMRSFVWWNLMHCAGRKRAKHVGTFSVSSLGGQGAFNLHHPLVTSSSLALSPMKESGECDMVLICDHRTMDGMLGANALRLLEETLCTTIFSELNAGREFKLAA